MTTVEKSPAMPVYVKDILTDERFMLLSLAGQGLYFRLLSHEWLEGSIPASRRAVAQLISQTISEKLWQDVLPFFVAIETRAGTRLQNTKLEQVRAEMIEYRKQKADAGAKGAAKRWHSDGAATTLPMANGSPAFASASASSGNPPLPPRERGGRRPTKAEREANVGGRPDRTPGRELEERRQEYLGIRDALAAYVTAYGPVVTLEDKRAAQATCGFGWLRWEELLAEFGQSRPQLVTA